MLKRFEVPTAVVLDTTKVLIFKQITTNKQYHVHHFGCFRYHKGTDFQANHNLHSLHLYQRGVVLDTTKVLIFKQITTQILRFVKVTMLF